MSPVHFTRFIYGFGRTPEPRLLAASGTRISQLVFIVTLGVCICATVLSPKLYSQWTAANRKQSAPLSGNGAIYSHQGTLYLWNQDHHFQMSDDNGLTWVEPSDVIGGANPHVSIITASEDRVYAGLNFGTGNGVVLVSTDKGRSWQADTNGAPGHALGWNGMPVVRNIHAWGKWLYVNWDGPNYYDVQELGGPFVRNEYMVKGINNPRSVCSHGDTLFVSAGKLYYTVDGAKTFVEAKNTNYPGPGKLIQDASRLYLFAFRTFLQPCVLSYSDDCGDTWTDIDISVLMKRRIVNGDLYFPIAAFIKGKHIECSFGMEKFGASANVWKSTDLGQSWQVDTIGLVPAYTPTINSFAYTSDGYLWCSPSYENVFKQKIDAGSTDVRIEQNQEFSSLYPQPADALVHLRHDQNFRHVRVFDALGQEIREVRQTNEDGEHVVACRELPNGIYTYCLYNDEGVFQRGSFLVRH